MSRARICAHVTIALLLTALMLALPTTTQAHATSTSYLLADDTKQSNVHLTWDVAVAGVHWAINLDTNGDGAITWQEVETRRDDIATLAASHLRVSRAGQACTPTLEDILLTEHAGEPNLSLAFDAPCKSTGALALSVTLFFEKDATQRTLIDVTTAAGQFTSILSPSEPRWQEPAAPSFLTTFATFTTQGLWHVWIGYDHLAFLLLLLLPGVLRSTGTGWRGTNNFRDTARDLLRIVTAFTVAHSVTLALAATGTVHVPVRPVEVAIALSIVVAGLLNLFPQAARAG
jgi:hypothetical protein